MLLPANYRLVTSEYALVHANHDECAMCHEPLQEMPGEKVFMHETLMHEPCCRYAFCADCLNRWYTLRRQDGRNIYEQCTYCRQATLGTLWSLTFEPARERIYLTHRGLAEVRQVVGAAFNTFGLERCRINRSLSLNDIGISIDNFHLAMVNGTEHYLTQTEILGIPNGNPLPSTDVCDQERAQRSTGRALINRRIPDTLHRAGIRSYTEYMFPEFSPHTRFNLPNMPPIQIVRNLFEVRDKIMQHRNSLISDGVSPDPGRWLCKVLNTEEIIRALTDAQQIAVVQQVREQRGPVVWVLWEPNLTINGSRLPVIAVPRRNTSDLVGNSTGGASEVRNEVFFGSDGFSVRSNPTVPLHTDDPLLYDYAQTFGDLYEHAPIQLTPNGRVQNAGALFLRPGVVLPAGLLVAANTYTVAHPTNSNVWAPRSSVSEYQRYCDLCHPEVINAGASRAEDEDEDEDEEDDSEEEESE